jgi:hypothetical protein
MVHPQQTRQAQTPGGSGSLAQTAVYLPAYLPVERLLDTALAKSECGGKIPSVVAKIDAESHRQENPLRALRWVDCSPPTHLRAFCDAFGTASLESLAPVRADLP